MKTTLDLAAQVKAPQFKTGEVVLYLDPKDASKWTAVMVVDDDDYDKGSNEFTGVSLATTVYSSSAPIATGHHQVGIVATDWARNQFIPMPEGSTLAYKF